LRTADTAVREVGEALAAVASTRQTLHREHTRLERESEALAAEIARLCGEIEAVAARLAAARLEAERLAAQATSAEGEVDVLARDAERARDAAATARAQAERQRGAAALASERLASAERELERHRLEIADLEARRQQAGSEAEVQHARAEVAAKAAVTARGDLEQLLAQRGAARRQAERLTEATDALKEQVAQAAAEAERQRRSHLEARDAVHTAELALIETKGAWERLEETIALTLSDRTQLPAEVPPPEALPELEAEEARLAAELEALGPVNELAVAERDELEERHRFLTTQRKDLERSLESLGETVRELDVTCAARFLATLEEANVAFDATFRTLFGGGEARAELSDPEAPLDSGIEIRVRPPGKHTQSVLLLSGGEKALAAVALLLALFRIRPAPFCLLDEVDAPLDDANVERLCALLRELSADTQFLLITHNRRTMAHADVLYGVTMEEPGVSRIVSVRLEE
jgi:chromosome segregation protein